ncbi:MAG: hypothetical protein AABY22_08435, partial [Nanoarchaeota archaeon]
MCGINVSPNPTEVLEMCNKTSHRGEKITIKEHRGIGMGHNRLAIQGLDPKYDCPFEIEDKFYLFNGEIFNYKELDPEAKSDVELLNRTDVYNFDGDYAIVSIDKKTEQIDIKTDSYGKRQLYYREDTPQKISSEIKALIEPGDRLDYYYLSTVGKFGYYSRGDLTPIEGIKKSINHSDLSVPIEDSRTNEFKDLKD